MNFRVVLSKESEVNLPEKAGCVADAAVGSLAECISNQVRQSVASTASSDQDPSAACHWPLTSAWTAGLSPPASMCASKAKALTLFRSLTNKIVWDA